MVGGYSFERSKFNRATQALRQVGSSFKPIVYTAAIDRGYTPASLIVDAPVSFSAGAGQPPYSPQNYDHQFEGPVTLRHALEQSRNVPAVRVMEQLGPNQVIAYARQLGLTSPIPPYLPVALGAAEATLLEMTSAYAVFPNQGVQMQPYAVLKVTDRAGNVLEENRPEPKDAIRADTAYVMTNLLRGVVQRGTAAKAGVAQLADRRQDRHDRRLHRRVVRRLRSGHHDRRLDRLRPEAPDRPQHDRRRSRAADLDGRDEGVDRRPQGTRRSSSRPATSCSCRSTRAAPRRQTARPARFPRRSSPARSRAACGETCRRQRDRSSASPLQRQSSSAADGCPSVPDAFFIR